MRHLFVVVLAVGVTSCAREPRQAPAAGPPEDAIPWPPPQAANSTGRESRDSLLLALQRRIERLGHSRTAVLNSLGVPLSTRQRAVRGPNDERDSLFTLRYPGLEIILRKSGLDAREYFSNIRVVGTEFALPGEFALFTTTQQQIRQALGPPDNPQQFADTTVLGYERTGGPVIQFYILNGVLVRIRWVYEIG
jgi:hypothetical protein